MNADVDAAYAVTIGAGENFLTFVFDGVPNDDPEPYRWIDVAISFRFGHFSGAFLASFTTGDIRQLRADLEKLHSTLEGKLTFSTIEGQVEFTLLMQPTGAVDFTGELLDQAGIGNRLTFKSQLDQTYLGPALAGLNRVVQDRL